MNKMKSPNIRKWRSLLLLPLIVTLTLAFSSPLTTNKKMNSSQTIQTATDMSEIQTEEKNMITGKVIDSETNKPIPITSIIIYGTFTGTISDIDGKFKIASTDETAQIAFSYVGYETVIVTLKSGDNPVIKLKKVVTEISFDDVTPTEPRQPDHLTADDNMVFFIVEDMPKFPGGIPAISKYISSNIVYPEEAKKQKIEGTVIVKFTVDKSGKVTDVYIDKDKSAESLLNEEAIRVVSEMPKWEPGKQRGKKVQVEMSVPIAFKLK